MSTKPKNEGNIGKKDATQYKVYRGDTAEELLASMAGNVDEKYQKVIMDIINKERSSEQKPNTFQFNYLRGEYSTQQHRNIVIVRTATATFIVPILMNTDVNMDITIEIIPDVSNSTLQGEDSHRVIGNNETSVCLESDIKSNDGIIPMLVIPHSCEGNNNELAISQILDYLMLSFPERVEVEDIPIEERNDVAVKMVGIK